MHNTTLWFDGVINSAHYLLILIYFRYDPYSKKFTKEEYEHEQMLRNRKSAIETASKATTFGMILGTLGRQGNPKVLEVGENDECYY